MSIYLNVHEVPWELPDLDTVGTRFTCPDHWTCVTPTCRDRVERTQIEAFDDKVEDLFKLKNVGVCPQHPDRCLNPTCANRTIHPVRGLCYQQWYAHHALKTEFTELFKEQYRICDFNSWMKPINYDHMRLNGHFSVHPQGSLLLDLTAHPPNIAHTLYPQGCYSCQNRAVIGGDRGLLMMQKMIGGINLRYGLSCFKRSLKDFSAYPNPTVGLVGPHPTEKRCGIHSDYNLYGMYPCSMYDPDTMMIPPTHPFLTYCSPWILCNVRRSVAARISVKADMGAFMSKTQDFSHVNTDNMTVDFDTYGNRDPIEPLWNSFADGPETRTTTNNSTSLWETQLRHEVHLMRYTQAQLARKRVPKSFPMFGDNITPGRRQCSHMSDVVPMGIHYVMLVLKPTEENEEEIKRFEAYLERDTKLINNPIPVRQSGRTTHMNQFNVTKEKERSIKHDWQESNAAIDEQNAKLNPQSYARLPQAFEPFQI